MLLVILRELPNLKVVNVSYVEVQKSPFSLTILCLTQVAMKVSMNFLADTIDL